MTMRFVARSTATIDHVAHAVDGKARQTANRRRIRFMSPSPAIASLLDRRQEILNLLHRVVDFHLVRDLAELFVRLPAIAAHPACYDARRIRIGGSRATAPTATSRSATTGPLTARRWRR